MTRRRRVTSTDVARAAGVSRATVSYVLNDVPDKRVSQETRELVLSTAARLGHVPFAPARSLRLGRSDIVLLLVRDFDLGYVARAMIGALDTALVQRGMVMLVERYDPSLRSVAELWQMVSPTLVVAMGGLTVSEQSAIEVSTERFLRLQGTVPNARVGQLQAEYLAMRGHRYIGYAMPSASSTAIIAGERLSGFKARLVELGLPEPLVERVDTDDPDSVRTAVSRWREEPGLTAVAAHSDSIGLMICACLEAEGVVPGVDLAVMGVDDIPQARFALTTVRIDVIQWATQVVDAVVALLDDHAAPGFTSDIVDLVVRRTA